MEASVLIEHGALVFGLTEMLKMVIPKGYVSKITPILAVVVGVGTHVYLSGYTPENAAYGAVLGLTAAGLYKAVTK